MKWFQQFGETDLRYFRYSLTITITITITLTKRVINCQTVLNTLTAHNDLLASLENIDSITEASYTDNTPALYWTKKGSTSTSIPAAYLL